MTSTKAGCRKRKIRPRHIVMERLEGRIVLSGLGTTGVLGQTAVQPSRVEPGVTLSGDTTVNGTTSLAIAGYAAIWNCRLETRPSGQDIGWVSPAGAYVDYVLNVQAPGTYSASVATAAISNASMSLRLDGTLVASYGLPNTGSWDVYRTTAQNLTLTAGVHTLRLASTNGTQYNLAGITLTGVGTSAPAPSAGTVTTVGAGTTVVPLAGYSAIWNSKLETRASGQDIGWVSPAGAYVEYRLNVQGAGNYALNIGAATPNGAAFVVLVNGAQAASYSVAGTGSWDVYRTQTQTLWLPAGAVTLRIQASNGTQYNINGIGIAAGGSTPAPAPGPVVTGGNATVAQRWMTSFTELDITGSAGSDNLTISQSGATLVINCNGNVQTVTGSFGDLVVRTGGGNDTVTIDSSVNIATRLYGGWGNDTLRNSTRGKATIVSIGGGYDVVQGNGINTSYWVDPGDTVNASSAEWGTGRVHQVSSFYGGVSTQLAGGSLPDPSGTGALTRLTSSSFWGTGPVQEDVLQGQSSDCYFVATLSALAYSMPDRLREMAVDLGDGTYAVQFKRSGVTTFVRIDGDLPGAGPYQNGIMYAHPGPSGAEWAPLLEKAYAIFRSGAWAYSSLNTGWIGAVMGDFGVANQTIGSGADPNAFYNMVSGALGSGRAVAMATNQYVSGAPLVGYHSYAFIRAYRDGYGNPVFVLRNPWGYDGGGGSGDPSDGIITLNFWQIQANFGSGAMAV